jgi:hypothetical protein
MPPPSPARTGRTRSLRGLPGQRRALAASLPNAWVTTAAAIRKVRGLGRYRQASADRAVLWLACPASCTGWAAARFGMLALGGAGHAGRDHGLPRHRVVAGGWGWR